MVMEGCNHRGEWGCGKEGTVRNVLKNSNGFVWEVAGNGCFGAFGGILFIRSSAVVLPYLCRSMFGDGWMWAIEWWNIPKRAGRRCKAHAKIKGGREMSPVRPEAICLERQ